MHVCMCTSGDEIGHLIAFKNALSLSDEDAAPVFLDIGRRLQRVARQEHLSQPQAGRLLAHVAVQAHQYCPIC